jgi:chromosome partitioning protein
MKKIIAVFNQAGGVAKTTVAMNVGYHLSQLKQKVLLIDVDPQASLSIFCGLEPLDLEQTIYEALLLDKSMPIYVLRDLGVDLVPANIQLSGAEIELVNSDLRDYRLKEAIAPVENQYDYILLDCPPSLGILSYICLVAATHILVPIATQYKAWMGTDLLLRTVSRVQKRANKELKVMGFVPTMYVKNNSQDVRALSAIQEQLGQLAEVFSPIPRTTAFADASEAHKSLAQYQSRNPAIKSLTEIAEKIINV